MVKGMIGGGTEAYVGLKKLTNYYLVVNDHFEYWFIYMNLDPLKGISKEERTIIQNAVSEMEARRFRVAEADEQASIKRLSDQRPEIITFTEQHLAKMTKKVHQNVWPVLSKDIGEVFDEVILTVQT